MKKRFVSDYIIPAIILAGTALALFYQAVDISPDFGLNLKIFDSFSEGFEAYQMNTPQVWRSRLFSNALASFFVRVSKSILIRVSIPRIGDPIQLAVGLWTMAWFLLVGVLFILWLKKRSLFYLLGTYAGVSFGYFPIGASLFSPLSKNFIYPWDLPALSLFTLFTILFIKKKYRWLLLLLPLGVGFKETSIILCLGFLLKDIVGKSWNPLRKSFWSNTQRESWVLFFLSLFLCLGVKIAIDLSVRASTPFMTMEYYANEVQIPIFVANLEQLSVYTLLINAGTFLAFLILPSGEETVKVFKWLAVAFIVGNFLFGIVAEFRIWFEMIPFALYALDRNLATEFS